MKKNRMAVVGGGFGASFHWHEHPACEVTAVADAREDRQQALTKQYGCNNVFRSLEEMFEKASDTFDAVAIFSDPPKHADHSIFCMESGKHVVCACPVAFSLEDCARVKEAKERTGMKYMMAESSYYRQEVIAARELYQAGAFGKILFSECEYYHPGIGSRSHVLSWRDSKKTWVHGLPPMLYPTHSLGFLVSVTGERIVRLSCQGQTVGDFPAPEENNYDNPFNNEITLGVTDQGNLCKFLVCWNFAAEEERAQWLGEKMSCYMPGAGGQPRAMIKTEKEFTPWVFEPFWKSDRLPERMRHDSGHGGSAVFLCCEFIDALLEEREPVIDIYESLAMTVPGIIAHESALKGGLLMDVPELWASR